MKLTAIIASSCVAASWADAASPVSKALDLLSSLQGKIIKEGEGSQTVYKEFSEWCEDRARTLSHSIQTGSAEIEELKSAIASSAATILETGAKVEELASDIAQDEADLKAATDIRGKEHKDFLAEEAELVETISMLKRAVGIIEREMSKGTPALAQVNNAKSLADAFSAMMQASVLSSADASRLTALVQTENQGEASVSQGEAADLEALGAPAAAVYESKSGNIVETLEDLLEKAESLLGEARKTEATNLHNYEMLEQSLSDEIKFANKDLSAAKKSGAAASEAKAVAEGDLAETSKDLQADTTSKSDLHADCLSKAMDFEAETKSRSEELEAIAHAKTALEEMTGSAEAATYGTSFVQTASSSSVRLSSGSDLKVFEAVRAVRDLGRKEHSQAIALLAQRMSALGSRSAGHTSDVFGKVKGLIGQLIEKLEAESAAEADHKAYCDKELKETGAKKAEKEAAIEKMNVKIDQMTSKASKLKEQVAELNAALAELASTQAQMDKVRASEKELFTSTKADLEAGLEGVKLALKVLSEYYAKDASHQTATGESTSIIGLLEVVESDFAKNLAEIESTEEAAAASYKQETKDNDMEKVTKEQDVKYKAKEAAGLEKDSAALSGDRANVQAELDAILEYLSKIQGECTVKAETYEERKAHREAEIAGLKQALEILESETALVQRRSLRYRKFSK